MSAFGVVLAIALGIIAQADENCLTLARADNRGGKKTVGAVPDRRFAMGDGRFEAFRREEQICERHVSLGAKWSARRRIGEDLFPARRRGFAFAGLLEGAGEGEARA